MKKFKRLITATILIILCSVCAMLPAAAETSLTEDVVVSLRIDDPVMQINGAVTEIDPGRRTEPVVVNGRTLVPVRAIIEAFGGKVGWNDVTQTVTLTMDGDVIILGINLRTAYLNGTEHTLDVAPVVMNGRTMLPIRFVAESFNLGVAWEADSRTVTIIRNSLDEDEYNYLEENIPRYSGYPYVEINNDTPFFEDYEIIGGSFEYYSNLDDLNRCGVCMASVAEDLMPTEERGSISSVTPTGWVNVKYETVPGGYLYNRCHLIGYQLTGENANRKNLITGTRYLNVDGMLHFENLIDDYVDSTGNHVMYRVTPFFRDNNLVAEGILLEACSVEDNGDGILLYDYTYEKSTNQKVIDGLGIGALGLCTAGLVISAVLTSGATAPEVVSVVIILVDRIAKSS